MMSTVFKGMSMRKSLVVLFFATLLPVWAQSQSQSVAKAKQPQTSAQAKARAEADLTARLQARAIAQAQAQAQAAALAKAPVPPSPQPSVGAAPAEGVPAFVSPSQLTEQQAPAAMQPLPAWTEVQQTRSDVPATATQSAVPSMANSAPVVAVQPMAAVASGLAVSAPLAQSASDSISQDLAIAQKIHQGLMPCEMGASVRVEADAAAPGYFHVQGKGFRYRMYPVRTSTGALRLEDKKAGAVWLQLANKSMLMDQKKGRRMADECAHPEQVAYGQDMKTNPPPSLFDKTGMGRSND
jgi:hypothetical protein